MKEKKVDEGRSRDDEGEKKMNGEESG